MHFHYDLDSNIEIYIFYLKLITNPKEKNTPSLIGHRYTKWIYFGWEDKGPQSKHNNNIRLFISYVLSQIQIFYVPPIHEYNLYVSNISYILLVSFLIFG